MSLLSLIDEIRSGFVRSDFLYFVSKINTRRFLNLANNYIGRKTGKFIFPPRPTTLFIEIVNGCNFNCVGCRAGTLFEKSKMPLETFVEILDKFDDALFLYPYGVGESFLHRDVYKMLSYAVRKNFIVLPFSNFSVIDPEKLIQTGIRKIFASIDTFDKQKFSEIREGGKIDIVVKNIKKLQYQKRKLNTNFPEICINCTVMKENSNDLEDIVLKGLELGISSFYFQTLYTADFLKPSTNIPDKNDIEKIKLLKRKYKGTANIYLISHYDYERGDYFSGFCQFAYSTLFITTDGNTYPCICGTVPEKRKKGVFGNIFSDGTDGVIFQRNEFLNIFRENPPKWCEGCPIYHRNC